tara:strand:- start:15485 stop:15877 length:393 start_codon:yes stop_codon:yes gene_type:complete
VYKKIMKIMKIMKLKKFKDFSVNESFTLNESIDLKEVKKAEKMMADKFKKSYNKLMDDMSKEASKMFKGKEVTGIEAYEDPDYTRDTDIKPSDVITVEDAHVVLGEGVFEPNPELVFKVKGKEYYVSTVV